MDVKKTSEQSVMSSKLPEGYYRFQVGDAESIKKDIRSDDPGSGNVRITVPLSVVGGPEDGGRMSISLWNKANYDMTRSDHQSAVMFAKVAVGTGTEEVAGKALPEGYEWGDDADPSQGKTAAIDRAYQYITKYWADKLFIGEVKHQAKSGFAYIDETWKNNDKDAPVDEQGNVKPNKKSKGKTTSTGAPVQDTTTNVAESEEFADWT